ncbi:MAG: hypothetical protein AB1546_08555 [bacterium]
MYNMTNFTPDGAMKGFNLIKDDKEKVQAQEKQKPSPVQERKTAAASEKTQGGTKKKVQVTLFIVLALILTGVTLIYFAAKEPVSMKQSQVTKKEKPLLSHESQKQVEGIPLDKEEKPPAEEKAAERPASQQTETYPVGRGLRTAPIRRREKHVTSYSSIKIEPRMHRIQPLQSRTFTAAEITDETRSIPPTTPEEFRKYNIFYIVVVKKSPNKSELIGIARNLKLTTLDPEILTKFYEGETVYWLTVGHYINSTEASNMAQLIRSRGYNAEVVTDRIYY